MDMYNVSQSNSSNESSINQVTEQAANNISMSAPANNAQGINNSTEKKGGKIVLNADPISFEVAEVEKEQNQENVSVPAQKEEEVTELPKEQSGKITF